MATPLDKLVNISDHNGQKVARPAKYDGNAFFDAYQYAGKLENTDIGTKEGIEDFQKETGLDVSSYSKERLNMAKQAVSEGANRTMGEYVNKNFYGLLGELDSEKQASLAVNFVTPERIHKSSTGNKDEDKNVTRYETARKEANKALGFVRDIKEKGEREMLNSELKELLDERSLIGHYLAQKIMEDGGQRYLQIRQNESIMRAEMAIGSYGFKDFIKTTRDELTKRSLELSEKSKPIVEQAREKTYATALEEAKAQEELKEKVGKLGDEYQSVGMLQQMNQAVIDPAREAIEAISQKKVQADAQKRARESAAQAA